MQGTPDASGVYWPSGEVFGSSPRVQGTPSTGGLPGWIVTYLSVHPRVCREHSSISEADSGSCHQVHPRVCREHVCVMYLERSTMFTGSSPRVQGTPRCGLDSVRAGRFIPACAGNTGYDRSVTHRPPVHPRVCREHAYHSTRAALTESWCGSSPRVQGTRIKTARLRQESPDGSSPRVQGTHRHTGAGRYV